MDQRGTALVLPWLICCALAASAAAQGAGGVGASPPLPPVEKLGDHLFRVGQIRVDTSAREISVAGTINKNVMTLEFIANTRGGMKAYESAVTLDTDAITFNTALVLIGLDRAHARNVPTTHFDKAIPEGDVVDIWLECPGGECQRTPAEQLMFDKEKNLMLTGGSWVYTGSSFIENGPYRAELDGVLIGFVHDPSSIIEYTGTGALNRFGYIVPPPTTPLAPGTSVRLTVRARR